VVPHPGNGQGWVRLGQGEPLHSGATQFSRYFTIKATQKHNHRASAQNGLSKLTHTLQAPSSSGGMLAHSRPGLGPMGLRKVAACRRSSEEKLITGWCHLEREGGQIDASFFFSSARNRKGALCT